jgi:hypothetical protein
MIEQYQVEKWIWTDADFDVMGWHDSNIYAVAFYPENFEFALDIDYIFQWIHPAENETYFKFWVAPATLIFEYVYDLKFDIGNLDGGLEIDFIERTEPKILENCDFAGKTDWLWTIVTHQGEINLRALGYKQYIRKKPVFGQSQAIETEARGEVSFYRGRLDA